MTTWLFQGNPRNFAVDEYLRAHRDITWHVRQELLSGEMRRGDPVYIWRADGNIPGTGGIVAHGTLSGPVMMRPHDDVGMWIRNKPSVTIQTVLVRLDDVRLTVREGCLLRRELQADSILRNLRILRMPGLTNYKLLPVEAECLALLWEGRRPRDL